MVGRKRRARRVKRLSSNEGHGLRLTLIAFRLVLLLPFAAIFAANFDAFLLLVLLNVSEEEAADDDADDND